MTGQRSEREPRSHDASSRPLPHGITTPRRHLQSVGGPGSLSWKRDGRPRLIALYLIKRWPTRGSRAFSKVDTQLRRRQTDGTKCRERRREFDLFIYLFCIGLLGPCVTPSDADANKPEWRSAEGDRRPSRLSSTSLWSNWPIAHCRRSAVIGSSCPPPPASLRA